MDDACDLAAHARVYSKSAPGQKTMDDRRWTMPGPIVHRLSSIVWYAKIGTLNVLRVVSGWAGPGTGTSYRPPRRPLEPRLIITTALRMASMASTPARVICSPARP